MMAVFSATAAVGGTYVGNRPRTMRTRAGETRVTHGATTSAARADTGSVKGAQRRTVAADAACLAIEDNGGDRGSAAHVLEH